MLRSLLAPIVSYLMKSIENEKEGKAPAACHPGDCYDEFKLGIKQAKVVKDVSLGTTSGIPGGEKRQWQVPDSSS